MTTLAAVQALMFSVGMTLVGIATHWFIPWAKRVAAEHERELRSLEASRARRRQD